jgi:hypothetical protein
MSLRILGHMTLSYKQLGNSHSLDVYLHDTPFYLNELIIRLSLDKPLFQASTENM